MNNIEKIITQGCNTCCRGDWMLWILGELGVDESILRLTAAHCANTVRHLMKDKRSIDIIDFIISREGKQPPQEMINTAAAADYADYAADYALSDNYIKTADICRKYLTPTLIELTYITPN